MRRYVFRLTFLALAAFGTSVVLGNDQQIDKQIANTILQKLKAEKDAGNLKGFSIDLKVEPDGTTWLSGRVSSEEQRSLALNIAARVKGVKAVVNDLNVEKAPVKRAFTPVAHEIGTGVNGGEASAPIPVPVPAQLQPVPVQPMPVAPPQQFQQMQPVPYVYARSNTQVPLAYGPARTIAYQGADGAAGAPMPISGGGSTGMAAARYDHPNMPGYAWPAYASHPNYAAVTYPKQYSPTAWPYIGPFYPYPQVPLGWRRVCLEWDDGWWFLDFNARRH